MIYNIKMEFSELWRVELEYDLEDVIAFELFVHDYNKDRGTAKWTKSDGMALNVQETRNFANYLLKYCDIIDKFKEQNPL